MTVTRRAAAVALLLLAAAPAVLAQGAIGLGEEAKLYDEYARRRGTAAFYADRGPARAAAWLAAAKRGDNRGKHFYGEALLYGTPKQVKEGVAWLRKAAEAGHAPAMAALGQAGAFTDRLGKDGAEEGLKWLRQAADKDDPVGLFALGLVLGDDTRPEPDPKGAKAAFEKLVAQRHPLGHFGLGHLAQNATKPDLDAAAGHYRKAAKMGNVGGAVQLVKILDASRDKDALAEAAVWKRELAKGTPAAFAGKWRGTFTYPGGKTETHTFAFAEDGTPMWEGTRFTKVGQLLSRQALPGGALIEWKLHFVDVRGAEIVYTLARTTSLVDTRTTNFKYVFSPVPGDPDKLAFEKYENFKKGPEKRLWGKLDRVRD